MTRAKRHYIPGHVWHITHRCHKREFLLKFPRDRRRWIQWLYQAKKRYSALSVLNYMNTSNHVHLLVFDKAGRNVIPDSIKLVAGRTGQEYNVRKNRKSIKYLSPIFVPYFFTIATNNEREFQRVPGLKVQNWVGRQGC
jgi:putative transposase